MAAQQISRHLQEVIGHIFHIFNNFEELKKRFVHIYKILNSY